MRVFDSDAHIMENELAWQFLPKEFHARRPLAVELPEDTSLTVFNAAWLIDEKVRLFGASPPIGARSVGKRYPIESQTLESIPARLADMDRANIDIQIIYPTFGLLNLCEDITLETELMKSYNTYVAGQVKQSGGRMRYAAMVPFRNPEAAVKEIDRICEMDGVASIFMRGLEWDKPISDPDFYPIYAEAEKRNLPIAVHIGSGSPAIREMFQYQQRIPGEEPFWPGRMKRLIGPLMIQFAFYNLMETPLATEFPNLRWGFLETAGSDWLMGAVGALRRKGNKAVDKFIDEGRVFVCAEPSEDLDYMASKIGNDIFMVCTDLPHFDDAAHENPLEEFGARKDVNPETLEKLLWHNASRFYDYRV